MPAGDSMKGEHIRCFSMNVTKWNPNESGSDPDQFLGSLFSVVEKTYFDAEKSEIDLRAILLGEVSSIGLLQYSTTRS